MVLEHLHQSGFANAGLAVYQDHVASALLDLGPALQEQSQFRLSPHKGRETPGAGHVQPTLGYARPEDTIHCDGCSNPP